ncbi:MAG: hypothetical protein K2X27_20660 [Candidatus Obscuribacterales bacterium]|nr:hypothetical protein [Candidatus Obscuribacterales bacterium]
MKKKPPPGATLIARLKEKRLQREQSGEQEEQQGPVLDVEAQELEASESNSDSVLEPAASESVEIALRESPAAAADLFQSRISIDDLRPSTDDYDALTDEIRLAGRFAAIGLVAQGLRLARIQHAEIHKNHYTSFEDYCRAEHQMSAAYAYRLIRMASLAEKFAERPKAIEGDSRDPIEVMLNLGHRHLMALLPLKEEKVEELLVLGVPLSEGESERVPLDKATEKQIKQALKKEDAGPVSVPSMAKRAEKMLGKELPKLVSMLEECADWLDTSPPEMEMAKMERAAELKELAEKFKRASDKIFETLSSDN